MLSKIKDFVSGAEAKEAISQLVEQVKLATEASKQQSELLSQLKKETEAAHALLSEAVEESRNSIKSSRELQEQINASIAGLKVISSQLQSSFRQKISEDMAELGKEMRSKLEGSERLKNEVSAELTKLKDEVSRLTAVAGKIKAEDFELTKFSQQLASADKEKLQLMARIDSLERLISKMRHQVR